MTDETKNKLKDQIIKLVKEYDGKKRFKPIDIVKEMERDFAADGLSKSEIKGTLKEIMDDGKLIYGYAGGSYLTLPSEG